jgi:hypothetical protein
METVGFARGTDVNTSNQVATGLSLDAAIDDLRTCASEIYHPLLLPLLLLSRHLSPARNEMRHREARKWLTAIEHAISGRPNPAKCPSPYHHPDGSRKLDKLNEFITECYATVLWVSVPINKKIIGRMNGLADSFWEHLDSERKTVQVTKFHSKVLERLNFHATKLDSINAYATTSMQRLDAQRSTVSATTVWLILCPLPSPN